MESDRPFYWTDMDSFLFLMLTAWHLHICCQQYRGLIPGPLTPYRHSVRPIYWIFCLIKCSNAQIYHQALEITQPSFSLNYTQMRFSPVHFLLYSLLKLHDLDLLFRMLVLTGRGALRVSKFEGSNNFSVFLWLYHSKEDLKIFIPYRVHVNSKHEGFRNFLAYFNLHYWK